MDKRCCFDYVISFKALYEANKVAKRSKLWKEEVINFQNNLGQNLYELHYALKYKKYELGKYRKFKIYDPKEREIQAIPYKDRVVQHSICDNYLVPVVSKYLVYDNVACRKNKGSGLAKKRIRQFMMEHYKKKGLNGYFIKIDISKYFDSINHDILKKFLSDVVDDIDILELLYKIIDSYEKSLNRGIPMGNQTSQFFALLFLNSIDHYIKEELKIKYFVRYMDDILIIADNKDVAKDMLIKIKSKIKLLDLSINNKSQIISIKNGVEFIGFRFLYSENGKIIQKVKNQTKRRILHKIKASNNKTNAEKLSSYMSYKGFLKGSNSYDFKERIKNKIMNG